jgi:glycosyltransferase involved in cell wall biosynthesis
MTKSFKISIVIPCFNHGEFLPEAVASVANLGREEIEIIVVNDGSTDERTREIMGEVVARGIKVIHQGNKGLAAARNAAVTASQGEYVFPLDADDRLRSGWIDSAIAILDSDRQVGVVYGDAQCFGTRTDHWRAGPFDAGKLLNLNFIHASALYRRSVWEQNSGYDGTMPVQGLEDWDFWLGTLEHGWRFSYVPEVFFEYRRTEQSMITRTAGFEDQVAEFVAKKHGPLYRQAWLSLVSERESLLSERQSLRWTLQNLRKLLKSRLKQKFNKDAGVPTSVSSEHANR